MSHRELFPGYFIKFGRNEPSRHVFGGNHDCEGAWCTNCEMPLMLHLTLDCTDPALSLDFLPCERLFLFYCMRCSLSWHDFSYRVLSDNEIDIVEEFRGETTWGDWYPDGGVDVLEPRPLQLSPIPARLQELYDRLNANEELTEAEEQEVATFTENFARPEAGGYPIVDVINQLGGRSFLCQRLDDPLCTGCQKARYERQEMYFLATLTNDPKAGVKISYDSVQIVYFLCTQCNTVKVRHSI